MNRPGTGGAINNTEAKAVAQTLRDLILNKGYKGSVGVVTPFRAQANAITQLVNQDKELLAEVVTRGFLADTVHRFQGDERDVMLFSPVVSSGAPKGALGFLRSNGNLFNVAIIGATDRMLSSFLDVIDLARVEAVATAVPKPDITLFYCDEDRKIAFEKASEGQRAAALLFMLLEQPGGPLIVDQPEGDLDNKIVSELAEKLHSAKQHRQILFASHNANIVVNGSSELVLGMDVTADAKRAVGCCGAIDRDDVCRKITETMEGGEKAFRDRKAKYGY